MVTLQMFLLFSSFNYEQARFVIPARDVNFIFQEFSDVIAHIVYLSTAYYSICKRQCLPCFAQEVLKWLLQ